MFCSVGRVNLPGMPLIQGPTGIENVAYLIQVDPTSAGYPAPVGAMAYSFATSTLYVKTGSGAADWTKIPITGGTAAFGAVSSLGWPVPFVAYTDAIDLSVTGTYQVVQPVAARLFRILAPQWEIKSKTGTVSASPTFQVGTNSGINDINSSGTAAGFTSQAAETAVLTSTAVSPTPYPDLSANGVRVQVTAGATLTGALTARLVMLCALMPL